MTLEEAKRIIASYEALLKHALFILSAPPWYSSVGDYPSLSFSDELFTVTWREYESDYYGGGHMETIQVDIDADVMITSHDKIAADHANAKKEAIQQNKRLRAAEAAGER